MSYAYFLLQNSLFVFAGKLALVLFAQNGLEWGWKQAFYWGFSLLPQKSLKGG